MTILTGKNERCIGEGENGTEGTFRPGFRIFM